MKPINQDPEPNLKTSRTPWLFRGLAVGFMLFGAANAMSYFFRTGNISDLVRPGNHVVESIGFPFEIWNEGHPGYGRFFIDYSMLGVNLTISLILGALLGLILIHFRHPLNRSLLEFEQQQNARSGSKLQFSVKGLLFLTTLSAVMIALLTQWNGTPEILMAIYFMGPTALILIAMAPSRIHWQHRVTILSGTAIVMISIAIYNGNQMNVPLDRVMLGIFVSWTSQSAIGACLILIGLGMRQVFASVQQN